MKTDGYDATSAPSIRRVGASLSGLARAASFSVRPMSRVGPPLTSSVGAPGRDANELSARSATLPSSGFVSYLVRFGSIEDVYESPARSVSAVSAIGISDLHTPLVPIVPDSPKYEKH